MNDGFKKFLEASEKNRADAFLAASQRLGANAQYVEKDFWVCWTLDVLYHGLPSGGPRLLFKRLLLESGGICAFPGCYRLLVSADAPEEPGAVIAEVAHIVAESREGPRGSEPLSEDERNQPANLIVVCPEHHKVIDSQPKTYSIAVLRQMKSDHVTEVRRRLHPESPLQTTALVTERIRSSVLAVTHLPQAVFEAKCAFGPGQEDKSFASAQDMLLVLWL